MIPSQILPSDLRECPSTLIPASTCTNILRCKFLHLRKDKRDPLRREHYEKMIEKII